MRVIVAVPRRPDNGRRDEVWAWVKARWERERPDWPIIEGLHLNGDFNRSKAINQAAADGGDWDVMMIADSDSIVGVDEAVAAAERAHETGQVTFAFEHFAYLRKSMSDRIMHGYSGNWWPGVEWTMTHTCSSMLAVPRKPWNECKGADEGFVGWGGEDIAISLMLQTFGGGMQRIPGTVWHLWHPTAPRNDETDTWPQRVERYKAAMGNKTKMRALIRELHAELADQ